jgi:two-component system NarL family sensor kinase
LGLLVDHSMWGGARANSFNKKKIDSLVRVNPNLNDSFVGDNYCSISSLYRQIQIDSSIQYAYKAIAIGNKLNHLKSKLCGYNNLGVSMYYKGNYDSSIVAFEYYKIASMEAKDSLSIAHAYNNIGNVYIDKGQKEFTLKYYDSALQIRLRNYDTASIANSYINIGYINKDLGNYTKALINLYNAIKLTELRPEFDNLTAYAFNFIASTYSHRHDFERAILFAQKAKRIYESKNDLNSIAIMNNMIGLNLIDKGDTNQASQYLHDAYVYYKQVNDVRQLALITNTLAKIELNQNDYVKALHYAMQAAKYHHSIGNKRLLGNTYLVLSKSHKYTGNLNLAITYADSAYSTAIGTGETEIKSDALSILKDLHAELKNYQKAYEYSEQYKLLNDSLQLVNNNRTIEELSTIYETKKKNLIINTQNLEIQAQKLVIERRNMLIIVGLIMILLAALLSQLLLNRYKLLQQSKIDALLISEQRERNKAIIETEEKERVRIARELHDGIGQQIVAAKLNMSALWENIRDEHNKKQLVKTIEMIDETASELRNISHNMIPSALIRNGLKVAVQEFLSNINVGGKPFIHCNIMGFDKRLDSNTETVLYRVMQEIVSNCLKHAEASNLHIQLIEYPQHITMMIQDDGKGFSLDQPNEIAGVGLKNIISRIEFLNGTLNIDSSIGYGTTITIQVPQQVYIT